MRPMLLVLTLLFASSGSGIAQETMGTMNGRVVDDQGLGIPGVTVTVTGLQGARDHTTDVDGIPELKRVIVAHQNQIVMAETLDEALDRLFPSEPAGRRAERPTPVNTGDLPSQQPALGYESLAAQAAEHYRNALQAQRDGNSALYGERIRQLGDVLDQMRNKPDGVRNQP